MLTAHNGLEASSQPLVERHEGTLVLRDDLIVGGTKMRFLPWLMRGAEEVVFGGPFCGGAPVAIAACAQQLGQRATIFYAARKEPHRPLTTFECGSFIGLTPK